MENQPINLRQFSRTGDTKRIVDSLAMTRDSSSYIHGFRSGKVNADAGTAKSYLTKK